MPPARHRLERYYRAVKDRRGAALAKHRGILPCSQFILLELQRLAHESNANLDMVVAWIRDHLLVTQRWAVELEPLLDQLRVACAPGLVDVLLLAGVYGADFRWLEGRCFTSQLRRTTHASVLWWRLYYDRADREEYLMWLS